MQQYVNKKPRPSQKIESLLGNHGLASQRPSGLVRYEDYTSKASAKNIRLAPLIGLAAYFVISLIDSIAN